MTMTAEQQAAWFTYHPPTEETAPKYAAIREAEAALHRAVFNECYMAVEARNAALSSGAPSPWVVNYNAVVQAAANFAKVIDKSAPNSADKSAAIRCVRLARNAANETLSRIPNELSTPTAFWETSTALEAVAHQQIMMARWQANSAIACNGV